LEHGLNVVQQALVLMVEHAVKVQVLRQPVTAMLDSVALIVV